MESTQPNWEHFRNAVAAKLETQAANSRTVARFAETLRDTDDEGSTVVTNLFAYAYDDYECEFARYADEDAPFDEWWQDGGKALTADAIMNAVPGLCPHDTATAILEACDCNH